MKKNAIMMTGLLMSSFLCHAGCPDSGCDTDTLLNGLYAGIGVGASKTSITSTRLQIDVVPIFFVLPTRLSEEVTQGMGVLSLGFSKTHNNFYFATEASLRAYTQRNHNLPIGHYGIDLVIKPGYIFNDTNTVIYPLVGIGMNKIEYAGQRYQCTALDGCGPNTFILDGEVNQHHAYYLFGGGIKQPLSNYFAVSFDVYYSGQQDVSYQGQTYSPNVRVWNVHGYRIKTNSVQGAIKLEYLFWD